MIEAAPTEAFEHAEHAEKAAHSGDAFLAVVSITIAILAVLAASVGSLETIETAGTINAKNEAVLLQNKATDAWNFYQAQSVKKKMFEIASAGGGPLAANYGDQAKRYADEEKSHLNEGKELERQTEEKLQDSSLHEHRHHILTFAVTLLHVSIAIATISIVRRGARWPWHAAIALGAAGLLATAAAYL
jgi:CHASE3 domain sensor protein